MDNSGRQNDSDPERSSLMNKIDKLEELLPDELLEIPTNDPRASKNNTTTPAGPLIPDSATISQVGNEVDNFFSTVGSPKNVEAEMGRLESQITTSCYLNPIANLDPSSFQGKEHPISFTSSCQKPPSFAVSNIYGHQQSSHDIWSSNQIHLQSIFALPCHGKDMHSNKVSSSYQSRLPLVDISNLYPAQSFGIQNVDQTESTSRSGFSETWDSIKASSFHEDQSSPGNSSSHQWETSFGALKEDQNFSVMTTNTDMNTAHRLPTICDQPSREHSPQSSARHHSTTSTTLATQFRESRLQSYSPTVLKPVSELDINEKEFCKSDNLESHSATSTDERPFECIVCHMKFTLKSSLKRHKRTHIAAGKLLACDRCDKKFMFHSDLKQHYFMHTGEKPFECDKCDKKFSRNAHLTIHYRVHTGEKPFECDKCDKKFTTKTNLRCHYVFHVEEKPYKCDICGKDFKWRTNLKKHYRVHLVEEPFKCNKCGKIFSNRENCKHHYITQFQEKTFNL